MRLLDIAEVARRSGLPASTLRYYEERGLIASTGRNGLRRLFEAGVLERLSLIALGRTAGFTLEDIAGMFAPDGSLRVDRGRLLEQAEALDRTIGRLRAMRDGLRHAARCPQAHHMDCPTFRRMLRAAGARAASRPVRRSGRPRPARPGR